ncbi:MAG: zinc-ribbon domain containing protein [Pyrinomonadaceae bacterium]
MSNSDSEVLKENHYPDTAEFEDLSIPCIDCASDFIWTAGEQIFFRDKQLQNPPKRCKECKKAKNRRLEAIETARLTGKKHRIEVRADCARCSTSTTVPFYPCQGRPVYCRACFITMNGEQPATQSNGRT